MFSTLSSTPGNANLSLQEGWLLEESECLCPASPHRLRELAGVALASPLHEMPAGEVERA